MGGPAAPVNASGKAVAGMGADGSASVSAESLTTRKIRSSVAVRII